MSDKSTIDESASATFTRYRSRHWIAQLFLWMERAANNRLLRSAVGGVRRFYVRQDTLAVIVLTAVLAFVLFQAGKLIAYAPEIADWIEFNWPDIRL